MLKLDKKIVRSDQYYSIGYSERFGCYVLANVETWIGWYEMWYRISEEEYNMAVENNSALDELALECHKAGRSHERYIDDERKKD